MARLEQYPDSMTLIISELLGFAVALEGVIKVGVAGCWIRGGVAGGWREV